MDTEKKQLELDKRYIRMAAFGRKTLIASAVR
jgi:hypothetical protein